MRHSDASPIEAPILNTQRLRLRPHCLADFAACASMWAEPEVVKFIGGKPASEQQVWIKLMSYRGHWPLMGFGYWALEEKSSGGFIGELGFADFKREIEPSIKDIPELGWALASPFHGKGYATEALRAAIAWGDTRRGWPRTVCIISEGNLPSFRVAEKCGYTPVQRTTYNGEPTVLLARDLPKAPPA